jgi:predicted amidophosphoribosyltransferase
MSEFFGKLRSGAGKAAFEADKVRRTQTIQLKIRSLNQEAERGHTQVGRVAYALYKQEQIGQPELKAACDQLAAVYAQIAAQEQEVERIKAEVYVDAAVAAIQYGHICPNGHGQIPPQNGFCQVCGARAIDVSPPVGSACPHCHAPLQPGARFCANCGQTVPSSPTAAQPITNPCPHCGAPLLDDAAFCTECGHKVTPPAPPPVMVETAVAETPPQEAIPETNTPLEHVDEVVLGETAEPSTTDEPVGCPVCGAPLVEGAAFCTECGHRMV